jgi:PIN domain nuclease of toxin-antitoxin system
VGMLLDTHVWVWSQESPEQLGPAARRSLTEPAALVHVSSISSLEIARLVRGERLRLAGRLQTWVSESLAALRADTVPLTHEVAVDGYELPGEFHRDPADRILVATARLYDLALMTADERILSYPHVLTVDARA